MIKEYKKLDDKIKELNSTRVFKKITPLHTKDWYIKWFASVVLILAMMLTSAGLHPYNLYVAIVGMIGWVIVGMLWHDRALIVLNAVSVVIYGLGIINHLIEVK